MNTDEIRRANLKALLRRWLDANSTPGEKAQNKDFAQAAGIAEKHLSQLLGGHREMGKIVARRIEKRLKLPEGWMDQIHSDLPPHVLELATEAKDFTPDQVDAVRAFLLYIKSHPPKR